MHIHCQDLLLLGNITFGERAYLVVHILLQALLHVLGGSILHRDEEMLVAPREQHLGGCVPIKDGGLLLRKQPDRFIRLVQQRGHLGQQCRILCDEITLIEVFEDEERFEGKTGEVGLHGLKLSDSRQAHRYEGQAFQPIQCCDGFRYLERGKMIRLTFEVTENTVGGFFYLRKRSPSDERVGFQFCSSTVLREQIVSVAELRRR